MEQLECDISDMKQIFQQQLEVRGRVKLGLHYVGVHFTVCGCVASSLPCVDVFGALAEPAYLTNMRA